MFEYKLITSLRADLLIINKWLHRHQIFGTISYCGFSYIATVCGRKGKIPEAVKVFTYFGVSSGQNDTSLPTSITLLNKYRVNS